MRRFLLIGALLGAFALGTEAASAAPLIINGTPGEDHIQVKALTPVSGTFTVNGVTQAFAAATSVVIDSGAENDSIAIVNPPATVFAPPGGIRVDGGEGGYDYDSLNNLDGIALAGRFDTAVDGPGTSTLTHTVGPVAQKIVVQNIESSISDHVVEDSFEYRATDGSDDLRVRGWEGLSQVIGANGPVSLGHKAALTINSKASGTTADHIELEGNEVATGRLAVDDGKVPPEDDVVLTSTYGAEDGQANVYLRAGTLGFADDSFPDVSGASLTLEIGRLVPEATAYDDLLNVEVDRLEARGQGDVRVRNFKPLQVGGVTDALGGVSSTGGSVEIETMAPWLMTVAAGERVAALERGVTLTSIDIDLLGEVSAPSGTAVLRPTVSGDPVVNLGLTGNPPYENFTFTYAVSDAELDRVKAATIEVGRDDTGFFTVSAPISVAGSAALRLVSGSRFSGAPAASVQAADLTFADHTLSGWGWVVTPTSVEVNSAGPIPYVTSALSLQGGPGPDQFTVTPSPSTPYAIDGGGPASLPGDTLTYNAGGLPVDGDSTPPDGQIRTPGNEPVAFGAIEAVTIVP